MDTAQAPGLEAAPSTSPLEGLDKAAEQIALFGRTPPPPAAGPEHVVQVHAHQRVTSSGKVVPVAAHQAHHHGPAVGPSPAPPAPASPAPAPPRKPGTLAAPEVLKHLPVVRPDGFAVWNANFEQALAEHHRVHIQERLTPTSWMAEARGSTGARSGYVQVHADGTISPPVQNPDALARRARGHAPEHGRRQDLDKTEVTRALRDAGHNVRALGVVVQSLGDGRRYAVRHEYGTQQDLDVRGLWPEDASRAEYDAIEERHQEKRDRDILKLAEALEQKGMRVTMGPAAWGFHVDRPIQEVEGAAHLGTAPASLFEALHGVGLPETQLIGFRTGWADVRDQRTRELRQEDPFAAGYRQGRTAAERAASGHPAMLNLLDEHSPAVARKLRAQLQGGTLAKAAPPAASRPPLGYEPAPRSHHGLWRKRKGDRYVYWHADHGHLTHEQANARLPGGPLEHPPAPAPGKVHIPLRLSAAQARAMLEWTGGRGSLSDQRIGDGLARLGLVEASVERQWRGGRSGGRHDRWVEYTATPQGVAVSEALWQQASTLPDRHEDDAWQAIPGVTVHVEADEHGELARAHRERGEREQSRERWRTMGKASAPWSGDWSDAGHTVEEYDYRVRGRSLGRAQARARRAGLAPDQLEIVQGEQGPELHLNQEAIADLDFVTSRHRKRLERRLRGAPLAKAGPGVHAPPGYEPAPGSHKGYWRKREGAGFVYWHPKQGHITAKSNELHRAELVTDRLEAMHHQDIERERATWGDQSAEHVRQSPARYHHSQLQDETGLAKRPLLQALERAVELGWAVKRTAEHQQDRRFGLFGRGGTKTMTQTAGYYGPAALPELAKAAQQLALVSTERRGPTLHAPIAHGEARCGRTVLAPSKSGHGRRWQCVDRQGKVVHPPEHRELLARMHRHGGHYPMVRATAERKHVQDLVGQGLVKLHQNPSHHAHEFTASLTAAGHRAVERARAVREADNTRRQGALFKGAGGLLELLALLTLAKASGAQVQLFGGATVPHQVRTHTRVTPSGGIAVVQQHQAHHRAGHAAPAPSPAPRAAPALTERDVFRLRRSELDALLREHPGDATLTALVRAEIARREQKRGAPRAATAPPPSILDKPPEDALSVAELVQDPADVRAAAFQRWFRGSKVRRPDGDPAAQQGPFNAALVVYHGTPVGGFEAFDPAFDKGQNIFGRGFYFTADREIATEYTKKDEDKVTASARGFLNARGEPIREISAAQVAELLARHGYQRKPGVGRWTSDPKDYTSVRHPARPHSIGPNPNWSPNVLYAVAVASRPDGSVDLVRFWDEVRHPTQADPARVQKPGAYSGAADLKADMEELGRNVIGQDVLAVLGEGARADIPASQLFEVYLSIQKPLDMETPASPEDVRALSIYLHRAELERRLPALGDFDSYEEKIRMVREDPYGLHARETPVERQRWLDQHQGDLDAAKERHAQALADLATLKAGGFVPLQVYADDLIDRKMSEAHYGGNYDVPLEHGALLALKQRVVDGSKGVTHQGRQVLGLLHLTPRDTLTWGDVHYILTNAHHGGEQEKSGFRAWAESQGYDGIRHTGGWNIGTHAHDVWIAWKPEAIKATTSERFDPTTTNLYKASPRWGARALRGLLALVKARTRAWSRPNTEQVGLFGRPAPTQQAPAPPSASAPGPPPAPVHAHPSSQGAPKAPEGFQPIPGSKRGGFHRKLADGSYAYWYPEDGERAEVHPEDHEAAARAEGRRAVWRLAKVNYAHPERALELDNVHHYVARSAHAEPASLSFSYRGHAEDPGDGHQPVAGSVLYGADHEPWELGPRETANSPLVLTSLRTGQQQTFRAPYQLAAWHEEQHAPELNEIQKQRRQEMREELPQHVARLAELRQIFDREPSEVNAVAIGTEAALLETKLSAISQSPEQVAELLGVSTTLPKTWSAFLDEYRALATDLQKTAPGNMLEQMSWYWTWTDLLVDGEVGRKVARWRVLHFNTSSWRLEEAYRKDGKPVTTLSAKAVLEEIPDGDGPLPDEVVRAAVRAALIKQGHKPAGKWLGRTIIEHVDLGMTTDPAKLRKIQALKRWCEHSDHRREMLLASVIDTDVVRDGVAEHEAADRLDYACREAGELLGNEPRPELYGDTPQARDLKALSEHVITTAMARPWYTEDEGHKSAVRRLLALRPDRMVRQNLKTGRTEKVSWSPREVDQTQSVPLTRDMRLRILAHQGQQRGEAFRRAHQERVERLNATMAHVRARVGDPTRWLGEALQAVAEAESVPYEILKHAATPTASGASPVALDAFDGPIAQAWNAAHPEVAERHAAYYNTPQDQRTPEMKAQHKQDLDDNFDFRQRARTRIARHVREAIRAHLGHPTDAAHGFAQIVPVAEGTQVTHNGQAHPVKNYDKDSDPNKLGWLLEFVHRDVIPTVDIGHVTWGFRAHCDHGNGLRLSKGKDGTTTNYEHGDSTIWHEYGHAIEHDSPTIRELANTLRDQRGRGEKRQRLMDIQGAGYEDHEVTYKDEWDNAYTGKWYGHQGSTEILSMGAEAFMEDPIGMYQKDPEHFYFTVGALTGLMGTERKPAHRRDPARQPQEKT